MGDFLVWRNNLGATTLPPAAVTAAVEEVEQVVQSVAATTVAAEETSANVPVASSQLGWSTTILTLSIDQGSQHTRPAMRSAFSDSRFERVDQTDGQQLEERASTPRRATELRFASQGGAAAESKQAASESDTYVLLDEAFAEVFAGEWSL